MKRIILILGLSFLTGGLFAQKSTSKKTVGVDLSLWPKASTQRNDSVGSTCLNIGLFSVVNNLYGVGVNAFSSIARKDVAGVQLSGITNIAGRRMHGVMASGLVNVAGDEVAGLMGTGLVNITGRTMSGIGVSGLLNIAGARSQGIQMAGMANVSGEELQGVSVAGLLNVAGQDVYGVQLAGLLNVAGDSLCGVQLGLANVAVKSHGLQIGLLNYKSAPEGFQLGLVNFNPDTRVQMMFYGGNATKLNVGVRFKSKLFYNMIGMGAPSLDFDDRFSASVSYRTGLGFPLCKHVSVSGDLGYQHAETFKNKDEGFPARYYSLQMRLNVEYRFNEKLGLFVSGGYGWDRLYQSKNAAFDDGVIIEGGLMLLKL